MNKKKLIGVLLCLVIIVIIGLIITYKDDIFKADVSVTYSDGCVEKYEGTKLISPICTQGRLLENKKNNNIVDTEWQFS